MKATTQNVYRVWSCTIWMFVLSLGFTVTFSQAATKSSSGFAPFFVLQNGHVSLHVMDTPLPTVLTSLASASHFQVRCDPALNTVLVSDTFFKVPLEAALERLLLQTDYAIIHLPTHTPDTPAYLFEVIVMKRPEDPSYNSLSNAVSSREDTALHVTGSKPPSHPQLAQAPAFSSTNSEEQNKTIESWQAEAALGQDEDGRLPALETLVDLLENDPQKPSVIRSTVLSALREQNETLQTVLLESLDLSDSHLTLPMLSELAQIGETSDIRLEALESLTEKAILGTFPAPEHFQVRMRLEEALNDPNPEFQEEVRILLDELHQESDE